MIVLSVMAMAILLAASITLIALVMRGFVRDVALYPYKSPVLSVMEAGRSQRELQAWRANQAEELEKLIDRHGAEEDARQRRQEAWRERIAEYDAMSNREKNMIGDPYNTGMAEFIGGPLNEQIHAMSEALPTFYWAEALATDWTFAQAEYDPATAPEVNKYTYERQIFFSSTGNAVYICAD